MKKTVMPLMVSAIMALTTMTTGATDARDMIVTGRIEPKSGTMLSVIIPTKTTFVIDGDRNFVSPDYTITNNSGKGVNVTGVSLKAIPTNTVKVVSESKFADWPAITREETLANIALGFSDKVNPIAWFSEESIDSNLSLGTIPAALESKQSYTIVGKYGHDWGNTENLTLNYTLTLLIELV